MKLQKITVEVKIGMKGRNKKLKEKNLRFIKWICWR